MSADKGGMILILGAGVTGLAAARVLDAAGEDFLALEREGEPGGWCRSISAGSYTFDLSGHFLHSSDPAARDWILGIPGVQWRNVARDSRIWFRGKLTPYPFQVNLYGHDPAFVSRCLADFAAARIRAAVRGEPDPKHLAGWLLQRFGKSMCNAFFFPYNRKMWCAPLSRLGYEWTGWSVPVPQFDDLLAGASGKTRQGMGYNANFYYPARGGIGSLAGAMARTLGARLRTGVEVARIDLGKKVVRTAGGESLPYRAAISTMPLPRLAACSDGLGSASRKAASLLSWVKVLSINMGVRGPGLTPGHWVYVPERGYPFFRAGFLSNVASSSAPPGCASIFVEKSFPAGARLSVAREIDAAVRGLKRMGILQQGSRIEELRPVILDPAYVLFDRFRESAVRLLGREFRLRGVFPAGRYGAWDYYGMEKSVADGLRAAREAALFRGK